MRIRKRAAAVAVLGVIAVVITGAVAVARDLRQGPAEPVTAKPYHVTVNTPRPGSPGRLIASGSLDGRRWQATGWRDPGRGGLLRDLGIGPVLRWRSRHGGPPGSGHGRSGDHRPIGGRTAHIHRPRPG